MLLPLDSRSQISITLTTFACNLIQQQKDIKALMLTMNKTLQQYSSSIWQREEQLCALDSVYSLTKDVYACQYNLASHHITLKRHESLQHIYVEWKCFPHWGCYPALRPIDKYTSRTAIKYFITLEFTQEKKKSVSCYQRKDSSFPFIDFSTMCHLIIYLCLLE